MMWYPIEKRFKTRVLKWLASHPLGKRRTPPGAIDPDGIRRILIIRQHDQFGDFLLTTPAIYALRTRFPDAHLSLVIRAYLSPVARGNPDVDEVLVFHESGWRWRPRDIGSFVGLMRDPVDLAVVFNTVSHSFSSDLIAWLSGAPVVMGPATPTFDHLDHNPFYTINVPVDPEPRHQIQRNLDVVRHIGADTDDLSYRYVMSEEEQTGGREVIESLAGGPGKPRGPVVAVHFGTGDVRKRYPVGQLARVCDELADRFPVRIVVIPAPGEDDLLRTFREATSTPAHSAPPLSLREVAGVIHAADLLVCNDTGVLHLAAAVKTPTLSFHATSDPACWKPPGTRHRAFYAESQRIDEIPPDRVCREIIAMLADSHGAEQDGIIRV
ncbi:MAG: glycosyltransferase family 9 protein [Gemmatimonadetes bacterium]|nr:glycosyltransferase family 9 protein [Gemmatimonadota bacterium]